MYAFAQKWHFARQSDADRTFGVRRGIDVSQGVSEMVGGFAEATGVCPDPAIAQKIPMTNPTPPPMALMSPEVGPPVERVNAIYD